MKDPAHALGELVPGLLLSAATGGTSLAANVVREGIERVTAAAATTVEKLAVRTRAMDWASDTGSSSPEMMSLGLARLLERSTSTYLAGAGRAQLGPHAWGDAATLTDHFDRHGVAVNAATEEEYARIAHDFLPTGLRAGNLEVRVAADGTIRVYDATARLFASYNPDGTTKTLFTARKRYWAKQPGVVPWEP